MSTDGGYTWNPVPGLSTDGIRRVEVAISQSNPDILYVVFEDSMEGCTACTNPRMGKPHGHP